MTKQSKAPFIRSPYNYDLEEASDQAAYRETMPSLTIQSQTLDTDINELMRRYGVTGQWPTNHRVPEYGDFEGISDYRTAIEAVKRAQEGFMALPAEARAFFGNDPQQLLEFSKDPANMERLKAMHINPDRVTPATPGSNPGAPGATNSTPPAGAPAAPGGASGGASGAA